MTKKALTPRWAARIASAFRPNEVLTHAQVAERLGILRVGRDYDVLGRYLLRAAAENLLVRTVRVSYRAIKTGAFAGTGASRKCKVAEYFVAAEDRGYRRYAPEAED